MKRRDALLKLNPERQTALKDAGGNIDARAELGHFLDGLILVVMINRDVVAAVIGDVDGIAQRIVPVIMLFSIALRPLPVKLLRLGPDARIRRNHADIGAIRAAGIAFAIHEVDLPVTLVRTFPDVGEFCKAVFHMRNIDEKDLRSEHVDRIFDLVLVSVDADAAGRGRGRQSDGCGQDHDQQKENGNTALHSNFLFSLVLGADIRCCGEAESAAT